MSIGWFDSSFTWSNELIRLRRGRRARYHRNIEIAHFGFFDDQPLTKEINALIPGAQAQHRTKAACRGFGIRLLGWLPAGRETVIQAKDPWDVGFQDR
jgi:hypothetical protein